jgi:hypothetical protein
MRLFRVLSLAGLSSVLPCLGFLNQAFAQTECFHTCAPNPGSGTYSSNVGAQFQPRNARGMGSPTVPAANRVRWHEHQGLELLQRLVQQHGESEHDCRPRQHLHHHKSLFSHGGLEGWTGILGAGQKPGPRTLGPSHSFHAPEQWHFRCARIMCFRQPLFRFTLSLNAGG